MPDGIIIPESSDNPTTEDKICKIQLGDFYQFSRLLKNLSGEVGDDEK